MTKQSTCMTCREFINTGHSDSIEDMGEHLEISGTIEDIVDGRIFVDTGEIDRDAWKPCSICETVSDILYVFEVTEASN